jgi:hypothetical protein
MLVDIPTAILATQTYLRSGKSFKDFEAEHGIRVRTDGQHIILDYNIYSVKWNEPYGYVCRGLVLDAQTFEVIAFGLAKFFNLSEPNAVEIDWDTAKVYEKIDGTMVNRWWSPHTQQFEYSTRMQLPDQLRVNMTPSSLITWQVMIDKCIAESFGNLLDTQPIHETWTFEACSWHNTIVVRHEDFSAKLLSIRDINSLQERAIDAFPVIPQSYRFTNGAEVAEFANKHAAVELEGLVVVDAGFNRVKVKSDEYIALHRLKDNLQSISSILSLVKENDYDEVLVHFPEYRASFEAVAELINGTIAQHEAVYAECKDIPSQKEFACTIETKGLSYTSALYNVRSGRAASIRDAFMTMKDTAFFRLFSDKARTIVQKNTQEHT